MKSFAQAMVFSSFIADSLALGAHWIYDTTQIDRQFGRVDTLRPPHQGGYHPTKHQGELTHYGDQTYHLLSHLTEQKGIFNLPAYASAWQSFLTDYNGYVDRATKSTLNNLQAGMPPDHCGSPSTDLGGPARIAPLVYCYRNDLPKLRTAVRDQTNLTHRGPGVVAGALFIAESCFAILHGATPREALTSALANGIDDVDLDLRLRSALTLPGNDVRKTVKEFGQACAISAALPGAVFTILHYADNLEEALIETVMAGGDSAARCMIVGMMLGAALGMDKIPSRWRDGLVAYPKIKTALDELP